MKRVVLMILASLFVATPALAQDAPEEVPAAAPRYDLPRVNAGLKVGYIADGSYDQFSKNNALPQFSVDATYPLLVRNRLVLGAGLGWDVGATSAALRGFDASLTAHKVSVPLEARYHVLPWIYAFGKVQPGAMAAIAEVKDLNSSTTLSGTGWAFAADASLGASFALTPKHLEHRGVRIWATPEVGYSYTTRASLALNQNRESEDILGSDENTALRGVALRGMFWRATIGMTF